jgi:uncharacterized membrane protein
MQASFKRNLILVIESILAFLILQILQYLIDIINPVYIGIMFISFSCLFILTIYIFIMRKNKKLKVLGITVHPELAN